MEELRAALKHIGLSEPEISVYIKLLYLKESTASNLGKELKTHRRGIYDITERLVKRGLISYSKKDGNTYYRAISPMKVKDILNERECEFRDSRLTLSKMIPEIEKLIHGNDSEVDVRILWGREGIKTMLMDEIREGVEVLSICPPLDKTEILLKNFLPGFTRQRIHNNVKLRMLTLEKAKGIMKKYKLAETRILPKDYTTPAGITIYRDKLGITLWAENPVTILIKNMEIAKSFADHFEIIWKSARK